MPFTNKNRAIRKVDGSVNKFDIVSAININSIQSKKVKLTKFKNII